MPSKLFYLPIEPYRERYSEYQTVLNGTFETCLKELGLQYLIIRPDNKLRTIATGLVVDVHERCKWAFEQTKTLLECMSIGEVTRDDVIYVDDFWHPGMEMLPYAMSLIYGYNRDNWPRLCSFCYAQSVDPNDFTYPMRSWMRPFEQAWAQCLDTVFVCAPELKTMLTHNIDPVCPAAKIDVAGLVYNGAAIKRYVGVNPADPQYEHRENAVVYSSRWDREKNPLVFAELIRLVMKDREDITFHICTGAPQLRSNDPALVEVAKQLGCTYPDNVFIHTALSKRQYFDRLAKSKVQFNCAKQDFVSLTILDATLMGCAPLYPNWLTFPDVLERKEANLYPNEDSVGAKAKLYNLLDAPAEDYSWVYRKHDLTVHRMMQSLGFDVPFTPSLSILNARRR